MYFVPIMQKVQTGQVIEFYSNSCLVVTPHGEISCVSIKDTVVGDYVELEIIQDTMKPLGKIIKVKNRKSELSKIVKNKRKLFASNISHLGIIVSPKPKTSYEFIDKWILKSHHSGIDAFIINNKTDLNCNHEYKKKLEVYKELDYKIINISAKKNINVNALKEFLKKKCVLFVGNSGAGKSTISSKLLNKNLKTNPLSNNQGMHTTSISSLYILDNIKIIDSPGMRDIEITDFSRNQIVDGFKEISNLSKHCKYSDCNHVDNRGCQIIKGVRNGQINENRYNNFMKFIAGNY